MGVATHSKSLIQFSVSGQGCVPSLLFGLRPNHDGGNEDKGELHTAVLSAPNPAAGHHPPMRPLETPGHSLAVLCQFLLGSQLLSPGSWCTQGFVCALQEVLSPVLWKFCNQILLVFKVKVPGGF